MPASRIPTACAMLAGFLLHPAVSAAQAPAEVAGTAARPAPEGWRREGVGFEGRGFKIELAGYIQGDLRSRRDFGPDDEDADNTPTLTGTTTALRRLRVGVKGEWGRLGFEGMVDPSDESGLLKDLFAELKVGRALRLRGGHFKLPVSAEFLTSAAKTDFVERAMLATHIGPARDWGVMAFGEPHKRVSYQVGVFEGDGRVQQSRAERTAVARLVLTPLRGFDLGGSYSRGEVETDPIAAGGPEPVPRGYLGQSSSGFVFYDRHFVAGRRERLGGDAALVRGPLGARFEFLQGREGRRAQGSIGDDLPEQVATGWASSATWLVSGEKKARTIKPRRPLHRGGLGALELAARYESMRFDDDGPDSGFEGAGNRARNIRPAAAKAITAGLSWWPETWARLMVNLIVERFDDTLLAPVPGREGDYLTVLGRLQLHIP